jgi:predicted nucleotidyltransferase
MVQPLAKHMQAISRLCEAHKVARLYAFGSVLTNDAFTPKSDIDLIVDFDSIPLEEYADNYYQFKFALENILNRPVDLLEEQAIRNPYFKQSIQKKRQLVYEH